MKIRRVATLLACSVALILGSCASGAVSVDADAGQIIATRLDEAALKRDYGSNLSRNPFIPFEGMFFRKRDEFIVVRLDLDRGEASLRFIESRPIGPEGFSPVFLDKAALASYWEANTLDLDIVGFKRDYDRRSALIRSLCLAADESAVIRPGKGRVLVFKAASPLPDSWALELALLVDGERRSYELRHPAGGAEE